MIREYKLNCKYVIVSEAGASVYSASELAAKEYPDECEVTRKDIDRKLSDALKQWQEEDDML